jgi:hypothetical protein
VAAFFFRVSITKQEYLAIGDKTPELACHRFAGPTLFASPLGFRGQKHPQTQNFPALEDESVNPNLRAAIPKQGGCPSDIQKSELSASPPLPAMHRRHARCKRALFKAQFAAVKRKKKEEKQALCALSLVKKGPKKGAYHLVLGFWSAIFAAGCVFVGQLCAHTNNGLRSSE